MSLLSMLGPSPDWIVGVSALELCLKNCSWVNEKVMNLYLWDAGTDSGVTYLSPNAPTIPQERIKRITATNPNTPESPFFDSSGAKMKPFAKLTVSRQRIYEKACGEIDETPEPYTDEPPESELIYNTNDSISSVYWLFFQMIVESPNGQNGYNAVQNVVLGLR